MRLAQHIAGGHLNKNQRYIENIATLAILQISSVYHNSFQIMDFIMTNLQKIRLAKILDFVPDENIGKDSKRLCIRRDNLQFVNFHKSCGNLKKIGYPNFLAG